LLLLCLAVYWFSSASESLGGVVASSEKFTRGFAECEAGAWATIVRLLSYNSLFFVFEGVSLAVAVVVAVASCLSWVSCHPCVFVFVVSLR